MEYIIQQKKKKTQKNTKINKQKTPLLIPATRYAKQKKPATEDHTLYDSSDVKWYEACKKTKGRENLCWKYFFLKEKRVILSFAFQSPRDDVKGQPKVKGQPGHRGACVPLP